MPQVAIVALNLDSVAVRTTAGHPFFTTNGWVDASDLRAGDHVCTHDGTWATVRAVHVEEEQPVHRLAPGLGPYPATGLLPTGTLIQTATGLKRVEDIRVGDYVVVPSPERN